HLTSSLFPYTTLFRSGRKCTCGQHGCLETVASASGIVWTAGELAYTMDDTGSIIQGRIFNGESVTSEDIFRAAEAGDQFASCGCDLKSTRLNSSHVSI